MSICYKIADCLIAIEGNGIAAMETLQGFYVFRANHEIFAPFVFHLEYAKPEPYLGEPYFRAQTQDTICLLYKDIHGYGLEIRQNETLQLSLHYNRSEQKHYIRGNLIPPFLRYALWIAFNLSTVRSGSVAVHSSAVVCQGKAILFLGESGTGKSTHTRLICQKFPAVELLNDDSPIIKIEKGKCMVYGSPWSGKTACYRDIKVELGGVVRLHQAEANKISLLSLHQAIGSLLPSFPPELYMCSELQPKVLDLISEIIEHVPIYSLHCFPDETAADLSVNTVIGSCLHGTNRQ